MIRLSMILILALSIFPLTFVFGQDNKPQSNDTLSLTKDEQIILYTTAVFIVIGIFLYLARDIIRKKKTDYDQSDFASQKDRDYDKYHSDWLEDFEEFRSKDAIDDEFEEGIKKSVLPDYYKILGVEKKATQNEIKTRFRQLAKELHPDKNKNHETSKITEVIKAYEILSDIERRNRYDRYLNVS